jgi:hypothetical protein
VSAAVRIIVALLVSSNANYIVERTNKYLAVANFAFRARIVGNETPVVFRLAVPSARATASPQTLEQIVAQKIASMALRRYDIEQH